MNAIPARNSAANAAPLPAAPAQDSVDASTDAAASGDALAAMRPAMDQAFAVGRPTDAAGAATILGAGGSYLQGASATLGKLDEGIAKRTKEIEQLRFTDPTAAQDKQGQLDMLQRLRDRIQLSIERVSDILAGKDRDDIGGGDDEPARSRRNGPRHDAEAKRREDLELLEQRRQLLAPSGADAVAPSAGAAAVAGTYAEVAQAS